MWMPLPGSDNRGAMLPTIVTSSPSRILRWRVCPTGCAGTSTVMRFAVSLFVIALGAILTFAVRHNPSGVNIHVIGLILMLVGFAGLAIGYKLYKTRRRTDVIYTDEGEILLEPNTPRPQDPIDPMA